jgi:hypothetical protein
MDRDVHGRLLGDMRRLRGRVYLADEAIKSHDLTSDGQFKLAIDDRCWHIISVDDQKKICACVFIEVQTRVRNFNKLLIADSALAQSDKWYSNLSRAVESEMELAEREGMSFTEIGGLAVSAERRFTSHTPRLLLATHALLELLGGARGIATATSRNKSAPMLLHLGLGPLTIGNLEIPRYYEPRYGCEMHALRFDSRRASSELLKGAMGLSLELGAVPVVLPSRNSLIKLPGFTEGYLSNSKITNK